MNYHLTIRCGKEICMIQRTEEGKKNRKYLLDLEDAWNTPEQGLFEIKEYKSRHSKHAGTQTLLTPKSRKTFRILLSGTKI